MRRKIVIFMTLIASVIVIIVAIALGIFNERLIVNNSLEKNEDIAYAISVNMNDYLDEILKTAMTLASAPIIKDTLIESNQKLEALDENNRAEVIDELNEKWKETEDSEDPFILSYTSNEVAQYLKSQQQIVPDYYGEIFLTNRYGELTATTGKLSTLAHSHKYWWIASYNDDNGRAFFDDRGFDTSVEGYVLGVVVPVYDDNDKIIGILKCNINIKNLFNGIIEEYSDIYYPAQIKIARSNGLVVYELNEKPLSTSLDETILSELSELNDNKIIKGDDQEDYLVSYIAINNTLGSSEIGFGGSYESIDHIQGNNGEHWVVVLTMPQKTIKKQASSIIWQFGLIGALFIFIEGILIYIFASRITKPIVKLVGVTKELNKGNLDKEIDIKSKDEVAELIKSFKNMIQRIKQTMASRDDLIEEIKKREKLEKINSELDAKLRNKEKLESIGTLSSGVAHEINNPLNGILNYSQLISDIVRDRDDKCEDSRNDVDEFSAEIIKEANRISKIVKNLLQFSSNDKEEFSKTNIEDIIENTLSLINIILKRDQIELEVNLANNLPLVECRFHQIEQVIMNLLTNGRDAVNTKYSGYNVNKKLIISVEESIYKDKESVRITIEDKGNGIPKEIQNVIFDPFFTTKSRAEGTGLGLSISYGIIKEHKGELSFESEEGKFTRFYIDLPLRQE